MKRRFEISTNIYSKDYLAKAWHSRKDLADYERRGFAQFFYLTICGHVESLISTICKLRIDNVVNITRKLKLAPTSFNDNGNLISCSVDPILDSLKRFLPTLKEEAELAPLEKLKEIDVITNNHFGTFGCEIPLKSAAN